MDINGIPLKFRWAGAVVLALACLWIAFDARSCVGQHNVSAASDQSQQHNGAANAHHQQADNFDRKEQEAGKTLKDAQDRLARANAALARAEARLAAQNASHDEPVDGANLPPTGVPTDVVEGLKAENAAQKEVITSQALVIKGWEIRFDAVSKARDAYRDEAKERAAAWVQEHAARVAAEGLAKAEYRRGLLHGFIAGNATGAGGALYLNHR